MLQAAPRGDVAHATTLRAEEDRLLRAAFGRFGGQPKAREAAAEIVRHYQQLGAGSWFLCDCRPGAVRPPALVPVAQTHIRRHQDDRWPVHSDACDFQREPAEQRGIVDSYSAAAANRPLRLVRPVGAAPSAMEPGEVWQSRNVRRPGIARLLARLMTDARLQSVGPDWVCPPLVEQVKALWTAARAVEIDAGVHLPEFLCTSPAKLGGVLGRIAAAPASRFPRSRPHGVLIARMEGTGGGVLRTLAGEAIPVGGRIAVFGERPSTGREPPVERAARSPYLAACVLGRAAPDAPAEVLSAYLHPCVSERHLMLVDSDLERQTFIQIRSVQSWLGKQHLARVSIEKPLFDIWPEDHGRAAADPRPPCLPDFVVRAAGENGAATAAAIETMGFADADYRARKERSHALMSRALGGAPVIEHDFHEPARQSQMDRDRVFWRSVRWQIAKSQPSGRATHADRIEVRP
ncbi:hypothetical protein [Acidisphaera sp. S103]|uniref:hypothetical protein n=1 Tax=Acidisphaera sp. S103 TaxID=1747223 RepID=UPI00131CA5D7|nr:hypothetical protein [Acidisphaera sp. S103]